MLWKYYLMCFRWGVDRKVIQLMKDRTRGNTMAKVWRQVQQSHCKRYLERIDLYTTLLHTLTEKGGILCSFPQTFKSPPTRRELPSPKLLRTAFLLAEANYIKDYRTQILSTFGKVLKFDATKKVSIYLQCFFYTV